MMDVPRPDADRGSSTPGGPRSRSEGRRVVDPPSGTSAADAPLVPGWLIRLAEVGWRVLVTLTLGLVVIAVAVELAVVVALDRRCLDPGGYARALRRATSRAGVGPQQGGRGRLACGAARPGRCGRRDRPRHGSVAERDRLGRSMRRSACSRSQLAAIGIQSDVTAILQRIETGSVSWSWAGSQTSSPRERMSSPSPSWAASSRSSCCRTATEHGPGSSTRAAAGAVGR